ncbi:hypothetical protein [Streptomyces wuyuanensis]
MVLLDADTAGCVLAWLNSDGALDPERSRTPQSCIEDLDRVVLEITDPAGIPYSNACAGSSCSSRRASPTPGEMFSETHRCRRGVQEATP